MSREHGSGLSGPSAARGRAVTQFGEVASIHRAGEGLGAEPQLQSKPEPWSSGPSKLEPEPLEPEPEPEQECG